MDTATPDQSLLTVQQLSFIEHEITAYATGRDAQGAPIPRETLLQAASLGLLTQSLPIEAGGGGQSAEQWGTLLMEIGRLTDDASFPLLLSLHAGVAQEVWDLANPRLQETHALPLAQGKRLAAFAYTEDNDAFSFVTSVQQHADHVVLSGEKLLVTGALIADTFVVYARTQQGDLCAVLIDREDPRGHGYTRRCLGGSRGRARWASVQ